jgi:hypothetical protein
VLILFVAHQVPVSTMQSANLLRSGRSHRRSQDNTLWHSPVVTSCQSATSSLRARATIMVLRVVPR